MMDLTDSDHPFKNQLSPSSTFASAATAPLTSAVINRCYAVASIYAVCIIDTRVNCSQESKAVRNRRDLLARHKVPTRRLIFTIPRRRCNVTLIRSIRCGKSTKEEYQRSIKDTRERVQRLKGISLVRVR